MSKVLVTGAGGFIGSHLVERLAANGAEVRAFVEYDSRGSWGWLDDATPETLDAIEIIAGNIRDSHAVSQAVAGCDTVVDFAGRAALDLVPQNQAFDMPQLFDACRANDMRTLAYPIEEYWVDIGKMDDYRRANADFASIF